MYCWIFVFQKYLKCYWHLCPCIQTSLGNCCSSISPALILTGDDAFFNVIPLRKKLWLAFSTAVKKTALKFHIKPVSSMKSVFLRFFEDILLLERAPARLPPATFCLHLIVFFSVPFVISCYVKKIWIKMYSNTKSS